MEAQDASVRVSEYTWGDVLSDVVAAKVGVTTKRGGDVPTTTHEPAIAALIQAGRRAHQVPARDEERLLAALAARSEEVCSSLTESAAVIAGCFLGCQDDVTAGLIASETKGVENLDWSFLHQLARLMNPDCASVFIPGEIVTSLKDHERGRLAMSVCATMHAGSSGLRHADTMRRTGTVLLITYAQDTHALMELARDGNKALADAAMRRLVKIADLVELLEWVAINKAGEPLVWKPVVDAMSDAEFYRSLQSVPNEWPLTHMVLKIHREGPVGR